MNVEHKRLALRREWAMRIGTAAAVLGLASAAVLPWTLRATTGSAAHPTDMNRHQALMHSASPSHGPNDEDVCVDDVSSGGVMGDAAARSVVVDALWYSTPHWDLIGSGKIDTWFPTPVCTDSGGTAGIEIQYLVHTTWASICGVNPVTGLSYSCVAHYAQTGSHYGYEIVRLVYAHIDGGTTESRQTINHETGHVFGLCDPDGTCDLNGWPVCTSLSVMHQYYGGCGLVTTSPQTDDINNVVAQMNSFP